jgi:hypothetical protein
MVTFIKAVLLVSLSAFSLQLGPVIPHHVCKGYMPENNLWIPEGDKNAGGITEEEFNTVIDKLDRLYQDEVRKKGGTLQFNRYWSDGTVNASAMQWFGTWHVNMYGGMARHRYMTADSFAMVACHELGHHLGGAPKVNSWLSGWASVEGESDYFAALKCLRKLLVDEDNSAFVRQMEIDPIVREKCEGIYESEPQQALCIRTSMAALPLAKLLADLRSDSEPSFAKPDQSQVKRTFENHPAAQCRLDTYFKGSLCAVAVNQNRSDRDPFVGACKYEQQPEGARPRCWFAP